MLKFSKLLKATWNPIKTSVRNNPYPTPFIHFLQNYPETEYTTLDNGLVVVTEERECLNTCVGFFIDGGSRYESDFQNGIAHFFEHIAFKRTCARPRTVIENQMALTGAKYRCVTTREMVAYYVECLNEDVPLVVDLLADCVFNNAFDKNEMEQQKRTIYCEMMKHDKTANEILYDYLHATAFQGTPLAQTVMGPTGNLHTFDDVNLPQYLSKTFEPSRTVFAAVGGVKHQHMVQLATTYLSKLQPSRCIETNLYRFTGSEIRYRDDSSPVANVAIAVEGPCLCHEDNIKMEIAKNIIGGWDRLQPRGHENAQTLARASSLEHLSDAYRAFNINYKDCGLWGIQFMGPSLRLEDMLYSIQNEWMKLCTYVTEGEVQRARRETKSKLLTETQSSVGMCFEIGRWTLYQGRCSPLHERVCAIDRVHVDDIREVCTNYIYDKCPAVAAVGTTEGLPEYTRIRAGMYWLRL